MQSPSLLTAQMGSTDPNSEQGLRQITALLKEMRNSTAPLNAQSCYKLYTCVLYAGSDFYFQSK